MRKPENNPTERIGRLLDDFEILLAYAQHLRLAVPKDVKVKDFPLLENFITEKVRRATTLSKVLSNRRNTRKLRFVQTLLPSDLTVKGEGQ